MAEAKLKNYELFEIAQRIGNVFATLEKVKGAKFQYALIKNIDILQNEIKLIQSAAKPSESYSEYERLRVKLCEEFSAKDDQGQPKKREVGNGQTEYDIDTESEVWKTAIEDLKNQHKDVINERDEQIKNYNEMLDLESTIKFHLMKLEDIPNELDGEQMLAIRSFIAE